MKILNVNLARHSYPIYIGSSVWQQELFSKHIAGQQVAIITNNTIAPLYLESLKSRLQDYELTTIILSDGEQHKHWQILHNIFDELIANRCERGVTLIALGGGVIGDITGFAASCYLRGVNFIQLPTTVLAQVDSSVGGKTGVNHPLGKNMLGAFYQPQAVIIDIDTLQTLPKREIAAGLAEIIKYGLICDANFFCWLEQNITKLLSLDKETLIYAINRSCLLKSQVVAEDEHEKGIRAILNLGHTFGHAIETHQGYGVWLHGEAVATGMVMALYMSLLLQNISVNDYERVVRLLQKANLPTSPPINMNEKDFMHHMLNDKKVAAGKVRLVLLRQIGDAYISNDYSAEVLQQTLVHNFAN